MYKDQTLSLIDLKVQIESESQHSEEIWNVDRVVAYRPKSTN